MMKSLLVAFLLFLSPSPSAQSAIPNAEMSITKEDGSSVGPNIEMQPGQGMNLTCTIQGYGLSLDLLWYEEGQELSHQTSIKRSDFAQQQQLELTYSDDCNRKLTCIYGDEDEVQYSKSTTIKCPGKGISVTLADETTVSSNVEGKLGQSLSLDCNMPDHHDLKQLSEEDFGRGLMCRYGDHEQWSITLNCQNSPGGPASATQSPREAVDRCHDTLEFFKSFNVFLISIILIAIIVYCARKIYKYKENREDKSHSEKDEKEQGSATNLLQGTSKSIKKWEFCEYFPFTGVIHQLRKCSWPIKGTHGQKYTKP
ncbi:uncharacterized protein LOC108670935 [Hyalella azteca]|uniref:Uncharacterized protein LOC108670935 n=1 Tax=Hyalella azteca TaxID=294128 RepID=A0A8B7NKW7_HYAAZ|nr:uncharacterized protein LOC108670935 [Hyalella azteca]